jgi:hypothetical protein
MNDNLTADDWETYTDKNGQTKFWQSRSSVIRNQEKLLTETGVFWYVAHEWTKGFYLETNSYQKSLTA